MPMRGIGGTMQPTPEALRRSLEDGWAAQLEPPENLVWKRAGGHSGVFSDAIVALNIPDEPIPRDAHYKLGKCERRIQAIKLIARDVQQDLQITEEDGAHTALIAAAAVCNRQCSAGGYTPEQWVLGRFRRLLGSILADLKELGALGSQWAAVEKGPFRFSLAVRESAARAFAKQDNSDTLRRGALAGSRGSRDLHLCAGDICHAWRSVGPRKRGRFVGPARLLGKDVQGWRVVYRNDCILADARQHRRSTVEEREA